MAARIDKSPFEPAGVKPERYAAIVLAGGFSQRMHSFKPLLLIEQETITDRLITTLQSNGIAVFLVTGYRQEELLAGIKAKNIRVVENPDYPRGMFSSVQAGLGALGSDFKGVFVAPVDIPLVRSFTIRSLISAAAKSPGKVLYPIFQNRRGHPPLIPAEKIPSILNRPQDATLKSALQSLEGEAAEVPVPDRYIHFDLDSPADFERLQQSFPDYSLPTYDEIKVITEEIYHLGPEIQGHSSKVAAVADAIGIALAAAGIKIDLASVQAAARLHDLAKGQKGHDLAGAKILREMGFERVAALVACHAELADAGSNQTAPTLEAKLVFLADKLVSGESRVSLEERFATAIERFGGDPSARENIRKRLEQAKGVKNEIELLLKCPLEKVVD